MRTISKLDTKKIRLNGIETCLLEQGAEEGLPLVFLHAYPTSHRMWSSQLKALPPKVRGIAYDMRGMGESELVPAYYNFESLVDDLIALLDHCNISRAVLCGLSMGGYLALRTVQRNPDRVKALVLCDTRSEADTNQDRLNRFQALKTIQEKGVKAFTHGFLKKFLSEETRQEKPETVQFLAELVEGNSVSAIEAATMAIATRLDTTENLSNISVPTLIIHGENDGGIPLAVAREMQKKIPGAKLAVIPHSGHFSNLEQPTLFNENLLQFLATLT